MFIYYNNTVDSSRVDGIRFNGQNRHIIGVRTCFDYKYNVNKILIH